MVYPTSQLQPSRAKGHMSLENELKFVEYGNLDGKTVIYFHGAPGSPDEASVFDKHAKKHDLNIICYDRFSID